MPKPRNSSPARSQSGTPTPRRNQPRRSRSVCSPALSTSSGRLTSIIDQFKEKNMDSFAVSPLTTRRSVLSDNTEIEIPRRKSWWKNLNENSRDVMELLEENKADQNTAIEDIVDIEVLSQEKKNYTLDLPESSDNESINSIVLPQRKLFTQKENHPQKKFGQIVGARETLAKLHKANTTHDKTVTAGTRELFQGTKRTKPIFPAALLGISPNKTTADKTKENIAAEPVAPVRNIFGNRPANKRKNMFADFIVSESEDDISDIQPKKVFGFQKKDEQRRISAISKGRDPSPTSSITTDIELDDWKHLPSSTMVENQLDEMIAGHTPVKRARLSKLLEAKESDIGMTNIDSTANKTKLSNKSVSSKSKSSKVSHSPNNAEKIFDKTKSKANEDDVDTSVGQISIKQAELSVLSEANKSKQSNKTVLSRSKSSTTNNISLNNAANTIDKTKSKLAEPMDDNEETSVTQKSMKQAKTSKLSHAIESDLTNINSSMNKTSKSKTSRSMNNLSLSNIDKTKKNKFEDSGNEEELSLGRNNSVRQTRLSKQLEKESNANKTNEPNKSVSSDTKNVNEANQLLMNKDEGEIIMDTNDSENRAENSLNSQEVNESKASETETKQDEDSTSLGKAEESEEEIEDMDVSQATEKDNSNDEENEKTTQEVAEQNQDENDQENVSQEINEGNESGENATQHNVSQEVDKDDKFDKDKANRIKEDNISTKVVIENEESARNVKEIMNEDIDEPNKSKQQKDMKNKSQTVEKNKETQKENQETEEKNTESDEENEEQNISREVSEKNGDENVSQVEKGNESDEENESQEVDNESNDNKADEVDEQEEEEEESLLYQDSDNDEVDNADQNEDDEINQSQDNDEINHSKEMQEEEEENDESENEEQNVEQENATEELDKNGANESDIENEDAAHESQAIENESENEDEAIESHVSGNEDEATESHVSENEDEANESHVSENEDETNENQAIENESEDEKDEGASQEIENEIEHEEPNESEDEEDEANESQEIENESEQDEPNQSQEIYTEQDQEMEDSNDANEAVAEEVSEDEQEEMEVDDNNEESHEIDAEAVKSEEIIEESPNVTHDTTGRNRQKVKSPEVILHDKTNQDASFTAKGRNTSIRKTKSMYKDLSIRPSLAPQRDSLGLSGPDSSAEGSGWDSHRTTRKTLRQTFGRDFTIRKSLRALVMEKSAKQTEHMETLHSETVKFPQANSTELPEDSNREDVSMESDHELSRRTRQTTLETYLQKIKEQNIEKKTKMEEAIRNSLKAPSARDTLSLFKVPSKPAPRKLKPTSNKPKKQLKSTILFDELPSEVIQDMKYKPPKRFQPSNASWITKRLYKYLESKLEPKYDYKARVRAEKLVETIYYFTKELRRNDVASPDAVDVLKHELARLDVVKTHFDFYEFFHEYMPREVRIKVVPDIVNKIPLPRHGVFTEILRGNTVQG